MLSKRGGSNRPEQPQAQVVIGVRRSGKSTLCYNALTRKKIKFAYVNFDDERLVHLTAGDLNDILEVLYKINGDFEYLFIDEIQNIPEWYLFVNRLLRRGMHIIITGSNANLLSGELATHLTGRHHVITLYPFSFAEYCDYINIDTRSMSTFASTTLRDAFDTYMKQGGFPEMQLVNDKRAYISTLVDNIIKRDIEQRFKIRYEAAFEDLTQHLLNVTPAVVVDRKLQGTFELKSPHTAKNYVKYLREAYLLIGLHKFSNKSRQRLSGLKVYPVDVALMNNRDDAFEGPNLGWRLETIVYIELLRLYKANGLDIYYYSERTTECDFIVCDGNRTVLAVQVSYDISNAKTRRREIDGLLTVSSKLKCDELLLITDHEYDDEEKNGKTIRIRPAYDYLLGR